MSAPITSSNQSAGGPDPAVMAAIERGHAVVFLDVALGPPDNSTLLGRIKLELYTRDVSGSYQHCKV
jgi:hypothetical protein